MKQTKTGGWRKVGGRNQGIRWRIDRLVRLALLVALAPYSVLAARYGFEAGKDGWVAQNWQTGKKDKCTNVVQSSFWGYGGSTNSLRMDCVLTGDLDTAIAGVTFSRSLLQGSQITARVYCPSNSSGSGQPWSYTQLRIYVKDANYAFQESAWDAFRITNGISTQLLTYVVTGRDYQGGPFDSTNVTEFGIEAVWRGYGSYTGALYVDEAGFGPTYVPPSTPATITNTEHFYDMESAYQLAWWKWDTNPDGWHAKAWTNVTYATNQGYAGSVALAAHAVFNPSNSAEIVTNEFGDVVTNEYAFQKGVFEIAYQPALNLSTKDHRVLQAKLRFDPAPSSPFTAKMYVYDKITDQWYFHVDDASDTNWNILQFDLDDPSQYATNLAQFPSPAGPMNTTQIGFIDVLVFSSVSWTGTVYLDEVVVAGKETQTNYTKITGAFVRPSQSKFVVGGTNFYFCGANIEYLQTVPDPTVLECLNWASSNHLQLIRTWAMQEGKPYSFQPQRGVWNELMFEHLDRIVAESGHRGIRLMLGLCDNWAHNGGMFQYVHWAVKEHPESVDTTLNKEGVLYHDQFWTNQYCRQWYKDYVGRLLNRTNTITGVVYKNDPTIFAWEIVNEPRCESDFSGSKVHSWLHEMSDWVRSIDTNHMLGNGEEGGYVNTYDFADTIPWEIYPDNYYHYATYATGSSTCNLYGCGRGHGVDFISDNKSESSYVQWQGGLYTNREPVQGEWRAGNSNINFCTARIYVDQKEYNVWRTNNNGADQRFEWINDHWYDSHETIGKPMILEEFGIHAIGWIFNGSYGQVQLQRTPEYTFQDRVNVYSQYYAHVEDAGISGSFFWNFGYQGMWDDPFHLCETVTPWVVQTTNSCATSIVVSAAHVLQGSKALKMSWNCTGLADRAIFRCPTNEKWVLRVDNNSTNEPPTHGVNRTKFFWNVYNPGTGVLHVALAVSGGPAWTWCESPASNVSAAGWTRVMFDLSGRYTWVSNGVTLTNFLINIPNASSNVLEDVKQVSLIARDLPAGAGELYIDNIQIKRDDGFVVYSDDPVNPVIKAHADRCAARNVATNRANTAPVASNLWIVANPNGDETSFRLAAYDANGDPISYRIKTKPTHGWVFGVPPNLVYKPRLGDGADDMLSYVAYDGFRESAEAVVMVTHAVFDNIRYDFEGNAQGWYANYKSSEGYAVTNVARTTAMSLHGAACLRADLSMNATYPYDRGDAEVDMVSTPPDLVMAPVPMRGQPLSISVFCPTGSRGTNTAPNRLQIYAKDANWNAEYIAETNVIENEWVTYTMTVDTNTPPGGWKSDGFDPDHIRAIGVRLHCGGTNSAYTGPIYIDVARFPVMERHLLYSFSQDTAGWTNEDWGCGNALLSWTNAYGNPGAGALVVQPVDGASYGKFYIKDYDSVENENLTYRPIVQTYIWVPCDGPTNIHHAVIARLVVRSSTDGWQYGHQSDEFMLVPCQWNLVSWDFSDLPAEVLRDVDEFGLELVWQNRDAWKGPVMVDSVQTVEKTPEAAPTIASVTALSNSVGRYQKFELTVGLNHVQGLNPFDPNKVDLSATFVGPTGRVWKIYGFYMEDTGDTPGNGTFRIRFSPNELGAWNYTVSVANHLGTNTAASGGFTCVASDRHGWIRVSDDDSHYFEQADDTPFIGKGYCHPWEGDDEGIFANAEDHGVNMLHWWLAPWDTMLTVKPTNPNDSWRDKSSYDTYEQNRAARLDRIVSYAEKHNVKLVWTIWPHDSIRDFNYHKWRLNGSWEACFRDNPIGMTNKVSEPEWYYNAFSDLDSPAKNQKFFYDDVYKEYQNRLYRYMIARWGYSDAIGLWALVSELFGTFANSLSAVNYQDPPTDVTKGGDFDGRDPFLCMATNQVDGEDHGIAWLSYINGYFKTNDPYGHPTTASYGTDEYWDGGFPVVDVTQIHTYCDLYNWITPALSLKKYHGFLSHYNKPAFMGEIGTIDWKKFEPDYLRVTAWPGLMTGGAITPMMWTTPAFSWFGDAKMGPWLDTMSDEAKVLSQFTADIPFHKMGLHQADMSTSYSNEPAVQVLSTFETGADGWQIFTDPGSKTGITSIARSSEHATEGTNGLLMNVAIGEWRTFGTPMCGIEKQGVNWNWESFWPYGTLRMDVYIPEFYDPVHNTNGFLLGINKDPRTIIEVWTYDGTNYDKYSTTNEFKADNGWKKLTVGMQWNLEFHLCEIPTLRQAQQITGIKLYFGDVGILRGPVWVDNVTAGRYAFNTVGLISSNRDFACGWLQDRSWTTTVAGTTGARLQINGLSNGVYSVEWWNTLSGPRETVNATASTGTLVVTVPTFIKDTAFKVRRVGAAAATVHDVAVGQVMEYDWVVRNPRQMLEVFVENQGTAGETFNVVLTDTTAGQVVGTNSVTLPAGASVHSRFWWNCMLGPTNVAHVLTATIPTVAGETDVADNTLTGKSVVYGQTPPWDHCGAIRRWAPDSGDSDARSLTVQTNMAYVSEGDSSFQLYHRSPSKYQAYFGFDQVFEDWSNRTSISFDLYNADGSTEAQILLRCHTNWQWYWSAPVSLVSGWNRNLTFPFTNATWTHIYWQDVVSTNGTNVYTNSVAFTNYNVTVGGRDTIHQIYIKVAGYTDEGSVYVDNIKLDGWYTLRLGMIGNVDLFPNAVAQQSNYTAAAASWMCARYLTGDSFTQGQAQIYAATSHDSTHNNEITPSSAASWLYQNVPAGYYFSARSRTSLSDAMKETVYWMDYTPAGGLKTPVQILSGTNWSYKVVRGFQASAKPYGAMFSAFTVHGMWLKDPRANGMSYDVYATAQEMENVYLPSTVNNDYWLICEPPPDAAETSNMVDQMDATTVLLGGSEPHSDVASYLTSLFGGRKKLGGTPPAGITNLLSVVPDALQGDEAFMAAYNSAPVISYYEVNKDLASHYYLAAGGVHGPSSTKYVIKLGADGSFQQATWSPGATLYPFVPVEAAVWTAQQSAPTGTIVSTQLVFAASASPSPFMPVWEVVVRQGMQNQTNSVTQDNPITRTDSNGDGMTDAEAVYAGLNPTNQHSSFDMDGGQVAGSGGAKVAVSWPSASGRTYSLYRGTSLTQKFPLIASGIAATAPMNTYTDQVPSSVVYYRVEIE